MEEEWFDYTEEKFEQYFCEKMDHSIYDLLQEKYRLVGKDFNVSKSDVFEKLRSDNLDYIVDARYQKYIKENIEPESIRSILGRVIALNHHNDKIFLKHYGKDDIIGVQVRIT